MALPLMRLFAFSTQFSLARPKAFFLPQHPCQPTEKFLTHFNEKTEEGRKAKISYLPVSALMVSSIALSYSSYMLSNHSPRPGKSVLRISGMCLLSPTPLLRPQIKMERGTKGRWRVRLCSGDEVCPSTSGTRTTHV